MVLLCWGLFHEKKMFSLKFGMKVCPHPCIWEIHETVGRENCVSRLPPCGSCAMSAFRREEETATHSSVLAWRVPGTEGPGLSGHTESDTTDMTQQQQQWRPSEMKYVIQQQPISKINLRLKFEFFLSITKTSPSCKKDYKLISDLHLLASYGLRLGKSSHKT